jgi:5-methylcytosine-specific restriction endonuclease McrBC regulatory subunit McrC
MRPAPGFVKQSDRLPPNLRHYEEAVALARFLLSDLRFVAEAGVVPVGVIAINMNLAYESAFRNLSLARVRNLSSKPPWRRPLFDLQNDCERSYLTLYPDLFLPDDEYGCAVILDTKWKSIYAPSGIEDAVSKVEAYLIRPRASDMYQALFYGVHGLRSNKARSECLCVLLYPTIGATVELYDEFYDVGNRIRIVVLGWNLSGGLEASVDLIWSRIAALRKGMEGDVRNGEFA